MGRGKTRSEETGGQRHGQEEGRDTVRAGQRLDLMARADELLDVVDERLRREEEQPRTVPCLAALFGAHLPRQLGEGTQRQADGAADG